MYQSYWNNVIHQFEKTYYTQIFWYLSTIIALVMAIRYYRKEKVFNLFILYIISSLIISIQSDFIDLFFKSKSTGYVRYLEIRNTVFEIIELFVFLFFFSLLFNSKKINSLVKILMIAFLCLCIYFFIKISNLEIKQREIVQWSFLINVIEFIMLLPIAFYYFYDLLTKESTKITPLSSSPAFWIVNGLFFYGIISLPLLLMGESFYSNERWLYFLMYGFHYIAISFLYFCIAKAFSCKTTLTV